MKEESFKRRYLIKIITSFLIAGINVVVQIILPRALSVDEYGYYSYNLNVFTSVVTIANLAMSNAFVAKYSKRNNEISLVYFYLAFVGIVALALNALIIGLFAANVISSFFSGQSFLIVLFALEASILLKLLTDCISIFDASSIARFPSIMQVVIKIALVLSVLASYFAGVLNLLLFYIIQISILSLVITVLIASVIRYQNKKYREPVVKKFSQYYKEFFVFCRPLFISLIVSQGVTILLNWSLMHWSGASEQAMFGAAWQFNAIISYIFSPFAELSKREFACIEENRDLLRRRFEKSLTLIVWLTSYFSIFVAASSNWIVPIVFGDKYANANSVTTIMMYYTIFQACGQICGSYLIGVSDTKASAVIGVAGQAFVVAMIFCFQFPGLVFAESLGAVGISINYLVSSLITSVVSIIYIYRKNGSKVLINCLKHIIPIVTLSMVSFALSYIANFITRNDDAIALLFKTFFCGIAYTFITATFIFAFPKTINMTREELFNYFKRKKV